MAASGNSVAVVAYNWMVAHLIGERDRTDHSGAMPALR